MTFQLAFLQLTLAYSKGPFKFIHISTVNISKMVSNRTNITIAMKYEVTNGLSIGIFRFILAHCKGQGQGRAHFDGHMSKMAACKESNTIPIKYEVARRISITIFKFNIGLF